MRIKITQLEHACFTVKKTQLKRRKVLLRLAQKHLQKRPEIAYYLSLGTVPISLYESPECSHLVGKEIVDKELPQNLWEN